MAFVDREKRFANINDISAALDGVPVRDHLGHEIGTVGTAGFATIAADGIDYVFATGDSMHDAEVTVMLPSSAPNPQPNDSTTTASGRTDLVPHASVQFERDLCGQRETIAMQTCALSDPPRKITYLMSLHPVFFRGKHPHMLPDGVSIVLKDVSELSHERNRAREHDQSKTLFLARMSHEIRTPLNGILGSIDLLLNSGAQTLTADQHSLIGIINHSSRVLMTLISDILDTSKMEGSRQAAA